MDAVDQEAVDHYFKVLRDVLEEHELFNKPAQIFNVDESEMPLDHHPPCVVVKKGQRKVRYRTFGNKSQVTVVGCVKCSWLSTASLHHF